ncbi:MAG: sigma-70 family RNA polymerase sigma factor, partial [Sphingobacteriales bacterium]
MSEDLVLSKAREGDINAFQELFAVFFPQLKSYLYRLLASRNDAEDIAHDTFIRAFDKLHTFKGEASLKTWVFSIATRLAYNYMEKQKRWVPDVAAKAKQLVIHDAS